MEDKLKAGAIWGEGVPTVRIIIYRGFYWDPAACGNYPLRLMERWIDGTSIPFLI